MDVKWVKNETMEPSCFKCIGGDDRDLCRELDDCKDGYFVEVTDEDKDTTERTEDAER